MYRPFVRHPDGSYTIGDHNITDENIEQVRTATRALECSLVSTATNVVNRSTGLNIQPEDVPGELRHCVEFFRVAGG